jgi:hypothetical protein
MKNTNQAMKFFHRLKACRRDRDFGVPGNFLIIKRLYEFMIIMEEKGKKSEYQ